MIQDFNPKTLDPTFRDLRESKSPYNNREQSNQDKISKQGTKKKKLQQITS